MDCLSFHSERIKKSSFLEDSFDIPTSVDDVSSFLPGMTSYTETDEFFIDIGRSHDREFLLAMVANIFLVPRAVLVLVRIKSTEHLDQLMNKLESVKSVMSVERNVSYIQVSLPNSS